MAPRRLLLRIVGALVCGALGLTGCTSGAALGTSGTVDLSAPRSGYPADPAVTTSSSITPTPVTPNGLVTGSGVDDTTITLGLLVDASADRGFSTGVALWQHAVNISGGICGRTIRLVTNRPDEPLTAAYDRIARTVLGVISMPSQADAAALGALTSADQVPTLTLDGSSADLTATGPVVIGATEDIKAINALAYLRSTGKLPMGSTLGTLSDSSSNAVNAVAGARWWAALNGVTIAARTVGGAEDKSWSGVGAVLAMAGPAEVKTVLRATPTGVDVVTNIDGYDPTVIPNPGGRLLVTLAAPAYGSNNPGAAAVAKAFVAAGQTDPGPDLMSGYGVAAAWGRLLTQACVDRALTHGGVQTAMGTVGPASVDSLFGPADPGLVVNSELPATRVSSVASADPKAPAGLRPLIWLQSAPDIGHYLPPR